jgi:hypothetical protein
MTSDEISKIQALSRCNFGSYNEKERFIRNMITLSETRSYVPLSPKQWFFLQSLYHTFGKTQIPGHERDCVICKAKASQEPVIYQVCPGCGYKVGMIERNPADYNHSCPRCAVVRFSDFKLERIP